MAGCVAISCVQCCDERGRELKVRALERLVGRREISCELTLLLVQAVESLRGHRRDEEESQRPR